MCLKSHQVFLYCYYRKRARNDDQKKCHLSKLQRNILRKSLNDIARNKSRKAANYRKKSQPKSYSRFRFSHNLFITPLAEGSPGFCLRGLRGWGEQGEAIRRNGVADHQALLQFVAGSVPSEWTVINALLFLISGPLPSNVTITEGGLNSGWFITCTFVSLIFRPLSLQIQFAKAESSR